MSNKIYVGNLPYSIEEEELRSFFSSCGNIQEIVLIKDNITGQGKGFGFITFDNQQAMEEAIKLNATESKGRNLKVNIAKQKAR